MITVKDSKITTMTLIIILGGVLTLSQAGQLALGQGNNKTADPWPNIIPNVETFVVSNVSSPKIDNSAFIHPFAVIIGDCSIGKDVLVAPTAVCRADEGIPIHVGDFSIYRTGLYYML